MRSFTIPFILFLLFAKETTGKESLSQLPGTHTYCIKTRSTNNEFILHLPSAYADEKPLPLVFFGHPNGGSAEKELKQWKVRADNFPFIAVFVNLQSSRTGIDVSDDRKYLKELFAKVTSTIRHDENWVVYTAHSGGGYAGWEIVATEHGQLFTALCFRSANARVGKTNLSVHWKHKPIYLFWSDNDAPYTRRQNPEMAAYLKEDLKGTRLTLEMISGGGHASRPEKFVSWLRRVMKEGYLKH